MNASKFKLKPKPGSSQVHGPDPDPYQQYTDLPRLLGEVEKGLQARPKLLMEKYWNLAAASKATGHLFPSYLFRRVADAGIY